MIDQRKLLWLKRLKTYDTSWEDGDLDSQDLKSADLINNKIKTLIELKLFTLSGSTNFSSIPPEGKRSLTNLSNRLRADARDANNKFKNHPEYKTILLLETDFPTSILLDTLKGVNQITISRLNTSVVRKNEFLSPHFTKIGWYFIFSTWGGQNGTDLKAIVNPYAEKERLLAEEEINNIFKSFLPPVDFNPVIS